MCLRSTPQGLIASDYGETLRGGGPSGKRRAADLPRVNQFQMTALSIGDHVLAEYSTTTTARRREIFDRDFGYYGFGSSRFPVLPCFLDRDEFLVTATAGNPIAGIYTTIRDGGLAYAYEGSWSQFEQQILWRVEVKRDGEIKGIASDHLRSVTSVAPENLVRRMIHDSIERLVRLRR